MHSDKLDEWPTIADTSDSSPNKSETAAAAVLPETQPKLSKSLPQVTQTPTKKVPSIERPAKSKSWLQKNELSNKDLAFLQMSNNNSGKPLGKRPFNKGKGRDKRRQTNFTSTPTGRSSNRPNSSRLSPQQLAAIKELGLPPECDYVQSIASSQTKRR